MIPRCPSPPSRPRHSLFAAVITQTLMLVSSRSPAVVTKAAPTTPPLRPPVTLAVLLHYRLHHHCHYPGNPRHRPCTSRLHHCGCSYAVDKARYQAPIRFHN
ncbi:hypothetical protein E2C01_093851 [Portunus trituberculatus]|uniref:Secreted protein n=1 Tax=Portunus trituberculatus TaxID=210409 RepID=A0A5B7JZU8_PORTR|nr:hypothetical protein [Portunus trituberculatus]